MLKFFNTILITLICVFLATTLLLAEENKESPIIINGDNVEYSADNKEVIATGNIEVIYKGSKLTCNKLKINMQSKEGLAEGNARLEDAEGIITGERIVYDFANKTGVILNANFRANPYFGKARKAEKVSESEFVVKHGYFTTCNLDHPHYRMDVKKLKMYPGDKLQAQQATLYLGAVPLVYLPRFNYSMKEPIMHVQVEPGNRKDWGPYVLNTWRYSLSDKVNARVSLDYRSKLGLGEGFEINYKNTPVGQGDFKFYFTNEKADNQSAGGPSEFQRYFLRWRHKWDIDPRTNVVAEFYKISDQRWKYDNSHNVLQDYFFREYEKDSEPATYALFHHSFNYSSLDVILQKRTNHWFDQLEKMPEINYSLPSLQLGESQFYFENSTQFGSYNQKASVSPNQTSDVVTGSRLDTKNTLSYPMKIAFLQVKPYVSSRQTAYSKGANDQTGIIRTIFYSGVDLSTKFYRIFDVKTNFLKLDIDGLRHIITPTIGYSYTHTPTIPATNLNQFDSTDSIVRGNTAYLGLSNKLQTKRNGQSVDFVDLLITSNYVFDPKSGSSSGPSGTFNNNSFLTHSGNKLYDQLSDLVFKLKVLPYSWIRLEGDATFEHSDHDDVNYGKFSLANYNLTFDFAKERSLSIGQRYERKGKNEVTAQFNWRLSPKWKFSIYERYNLKLSNGNATTGSAALDKGSQEQQLTLTRDLHCWDLDITLNQQQTSGTSIFFTFRLKAFPENEFGFDQSISKEKSGTQ